MAKSSNISLKLQVDTSSNKVVFAEAKKDFVDFVFGLLELPLGTILSLLPKHHIGSGSLCRVYDSVSNIGDEYLQSNQIKNSLLSPKIATGAETQPTPLLKELAYNLPQSNNVSVVFPVNVNRSPYHSSSQSNNVSVVFPANVNRSPYHSSSQPKTPPVQGYVKDGETYMVMDDLTVKPVSTISTVAHQNSLKVKDLSSLEEKMVDVDMDQGLKILKASFHSTTILTDVFLPQAKAEV